MGMSKWDKCHGNLLWKKKLGVPSIIYTIQLHYRKEENMVQFGWKQLPSIFEHKSVLTKIKSWIGSSEYRDSSKYRLYDIPEKIRCIAPKQSQRHHQNVVSTISCSSNWSPSNYCKKEKPCHHFYSHHFHP